MMRSADRKALVSGTIGAAALVFYALLFAGPYDLRVLTFAGIYAVLVLGYQFIFGHAGALSLAQGAFFGVGAYATAILGVRYGLPFAVTFPLSLAAPAALAAIIALPVLRLESHYFALATLGIAQVVLLLAVNWQSLTGGANGIAGVPPAALFGLAFEAGLELTALVWIVVGFVAWLSWRTVQGRHGLAFALMREDGLAAAAIGIDTAKLRLGAFLASAAIGGAAGGLHAHAVGVVSPEVLAFPVMVTCLAMAVIGGRFRTLGAVLGAVLLTHVPEWFRFLERDYLLAYGIALLAAVVIAPEGLCGLISRWTRSVDATPPRPSKLSRTASAPKTDGAFVLEARDIAKSFGGVRALGGVTLNIVVGEIVAVIGANGSGKTTLLNAISGAEPADRGSLRLFGRDIGSRPSHIRARWGIGRTFQNIHLAPGMNALDSVAVAALASRRGLTRAEAGSLAAALLIEFGLIEQAAIPCGALPHGARRRVEIARALAGGPSLLLLDEPAAGLTDAEWRVLADALRVRTEDGLAVIVVEHTMPFVLPLADRVICLDRGQVIAEDRPERIARDSRVIAAYLGTEPNR